MLSDSLHCGFIVLLFDDSIIVLCHGLVLSEQSFANSTSVSNGRQGKWFNCSSGFGGERGISQAFPLLTAQTVQAALATKQSAHHCLPVSTTPPHSTSVEVPNLSLPISMVSLCFGGVLSLLCSSASNFLAPGT